MKKPALLVPFLFLAMWTSPLCADSKGAPAVRGGKGSFMIGWGALDLEPLNQTLASAGYPPFAEDYLTLGGGGHAVLGRLVLGGQGHGYLQDKQDVALAGGNHRTSLAAGMGFFDLGVVAWSGHGVALTPMVGLGGGALLFEIQELSSPTFGEVLQQPGRRSSLSTSGFLVDLGVHLDWILGPVQRGVRSGAVVGLRAGWILSPFKGSWQLDGRDIAGGPRVGIEGPYVRFSVGGGSLKGPLH